MSQLPDFWVASGHHLVDRDAHGRLLLTDDLLKTWLARPELVPPPEACPVERGLYASLLAEPQSKIAPSEIALIADADARENFQLFLAFRDHLSAHKTLEEAWLALFRKKIANQFPPLFIQQLTHLLARNVYAHCEDVFVLRAAECFFRPQKMSLHESKLLLADAEVISALEGDRHASPLLTMLGGPVVTDLSILTEENAASWWAGSDGHEMVFDLTDNSLNPPRGRAAFAEALRLWIKHLLHMDIHFTPMEKLDGATMSWFIPLDTEATSIGNKIWQGEVLDELTARQIIGIFAFSLPDDAAIKPALRGKPAFVLLAYPPDQVIRVKAQNLIMGLPLVEAKH